MDAEHRHELKTNELADFIKRLPALAQEYIYQILGITLILIAIVVIPLYNRMHKQTEITEEAVSISKIEMARETVAAIERNPQKTDSASTTLATAEADMDEAVLGTDNPNLQALALLEKSELLRAELHILPDVGPDKISENISKARTACEQAFDLAQTATLKGIAQLDQGMMRNPE